MLTDFDLLSKYDEPSQKTRGSRPYVPASYIQSQKGNDITSEFYALGKTLHADPTKLYSFTKLLSKFENHAKFAGNESLATAIAILIKEITSVSDALTQDKISNYTKVLKELDIATIQFETALTLG